MIQICLFRSCIQFFLGCVSWIFPYSVASSLPWLHVATRVEKKGLSLPPWDCPPVFHRESVVLYSCNESSFLFIELLWSRWLDITILFSFYVIVVKLHLSASLYTLSFSSYQLRHKANELFAHYPALLTSSLVNNLSCNVFQTNIRTPFYDGLQF